MEDGLSPQQRHARAADWIQPPQEEAGLRRYLQTLRERIWIVVAAVVIATAIAIVYVVTADKVYEAEADLLIAPVASTDAAPYALPGLIRESSDPTRDVETASRLVTNVDVADRVKASLNSSLSAEELLGKVSAEPVASSNIVAVTAEAGSPNEAAELANAFATEAVAELTRELHAAARVTLTGLQAQLRSGSGDPAAVRTSIAVLEPLRNGPNPSMSVETRADPPSSQASPRPALSIAAGLFGGLVLGIGVAFAFQILDPRLRREEQLRRLYRLPILARIPRQPRSRTDKPLGPLELSPATSEAYRTLRGTLAVSRRAAGSRSHAILVTGSSPSEGKTTTAVNLSSSLATAGHNVILIEADLRRPGIGAALNLQSKYGVASVLVESIALQEALVTTPTFGSNLGILLADYEGGWISDLFALPAARELVDEARRLADFVIVDSPPLTDVIDALPLVDYVDDVVLVAGVGKTHLGKLAQLGELLAEHGIRPAGFAVVGTPKPARSDYHYYAGHQPRPAPPSHRERPSDERQPLER
ncbi:MAG: Wzz/FepE/Etk N-terminal domain-containing protein [Actinomycetota bacterium]